MTIFLYHAELITTDIDDGMAEVKKKLSNITIASLAYIAADPFGLADLGTCVDHCPELLERRTLRGNRDLHPTKPP
jgi:hypothetical protein